LPANPSAETPTVDTSLHQVLDRFLINAFLSSKLAVVSLLLAAFILIPSNANLWNRFYTGNPRGALYLPFATGTANISCCWRTGDMRTLLRSTASAPILCFRCQSL